MIRRLYFYNSLSRKKEKFVSIENSKASIYSCGPTIYDFAHIGNLRAYVFSDVLARTLKYFDYKTKKILNLTDVDDKTIRESLKLGGEGNPNDLLKKFTRKFEEYFYEDIHKLNIADADFYPRATDSIEEMEYLINQLSKKNMPMLQKMGFILIFPKLKTMGN
jgi:cysteinyl-tRNA synthetase